MPLACPSANFQHSQDRCARRGDSKEDCFVRSARNRSTDLLMKRVAVLFAVAVLPTLAFSADYNLAKLAKDGKIKLFNRTLDQSKAGSPESVYLNFADDNGLAWITDVEFSKGTIELEVKGKDQPGQSFVGVAFHGRDNETFDAVYLRPFNFQAVGAEHRSHSIQYISLPQHDWSELRKTYPGKYESALIPAPAPESWVELRLTVENKSISAFVNGQTKPALSVELLDDRHTGKLGLWVGNGSDGWFRNLKITPATK